jgi:hypothetical protein
MIHSILVSRMMHANKVVDNLRAHSYSISEAISIPHHKDGDAYPIDRFHILGFLRTFTIHNPSCQDVISVKSTCKKVCITQIPDQIPLASSTQYAQQASNVKGHHIKAYAP